MQNPWLVNHDRYEPADRPYTSPKDVLSYGSGPSCPSQTEPNKVDVTRPSIYGQQSSYGKFVQPFNCTDNSKYAYELES